jgi:hypothetical protein
MDEGVQAEAKVAVPRNELESRLYVVAVIPEVCTLHCGSDPTAHADVDRDLAYRLHER